jgi:phosphatidate cytidylyltransferase
MEINSTKNPKLNNFYIRSLSALILLPPVMFALISGGFFYFALIFIVALLAGFEWDNINGKYSFSFDGMLMITFMLLTITAFFMEEYKLGLFLLALGAYVTYISSNLRFKSFKKRVVPEYLNRPKWLTIGMIYITIGLSSMALLKNADVFQLTVLWVFIVTAVSDTGAYIVGSIIGGAKILPKISPKKSWSGFMGAFISVAIVSYFFAIFVAAPNPLILSLLGAISVFFAHAGDMIESAFKRYLKIKDTSNLIPGHGGILDRIDALLMVAIYVASIYLIFGKTPLLL